MTPPAAGLAPRTRRLLEAPIAPTLLRLAAPNAVVIVAQVGVAAAEAYFVGALGVEALAGVALVYPLLMLMQTMSAGGMGGGVSAAVARALGAGRRADADAVVLHALLLALGAGALFAAAALAGGPALYRAMGAGGGVLAAAVAYSSAVFAGAPAVWCFNMLANAVRGTGNTLVPAALIGAGSAVTLALSPALIHGWGPLPRLGVAGAGVALAVSQGLGATVLLASLASGRAHVRLRWRAPSLAPVREILRVGAPAALNTVLTNLTAVVLAGLVAPLGPAALAGYGLGARLEYLQIPLVFCVGSALVPVVGTSIGAGRRARALRAAWIGAAMAAAVTGAIGLTAALAPHLWLERFTADPEALRAGSLYFRIVGPTYGLFGLGMALYFASQGAGRLLWPLLAGFTRLGLAAIGGLAVTGPLGGGLGALCAVIAAAFVVFGGGLALAIRNGAWGRAAPATARAAAPVPDRRPPAGVLVTPEEP